ncbi:MAG TPA: 30S ribosomal protein S12 methylthiotransferase RimO [Phycisphaerae bacterium]|nr:30S ribosomal protein S12 methylthiotransferase RimO [Phycisphaerales bacterium]HRX87595.1 30S ribosomal protein S12 methylthiotransferase RimO [Phycisphaerae bacterium]
MNRPPRVAFVSLGCAKNTVDSEKMLGQLAEAGCEFCADERDADVVVVNTCGFLEDSRREADQVIGELVGVKRSRKSRLRRVVVAGCLVQRDGTQISDRVPGIDALVGVHNRDDVVRAVLNRGPKKRELNTFLGDYHPFVNIDTARLRITPQHWAYLRISEGCDQKCTFCTIPSIRGPMHCKPPSVILAEARELIADGAVELSLIGQDTSSYGLDFDYEPGLAGLLRELNALDGLAWIRLMYVYPSVFSDAMIDAIAECDKIVKYVDIPLQHINDRVLKAMHRRVTRAETIDLLERIRRRIPDVNLRTTLITGFPGETEAEHQELLEFLRDYRFDALGVFPYSLEPDTPAGRMQNQLDAETKLRRREELMLTQQEIAFAKADATRGKTFEVLVDTHAGKDGLQVARHAGQAPEVDSITVLSGARAAAGSFVRVRCTGRQDYDLLAEPASIALPTLC